MNTLMGVDYFIDKFSKIPESKLICNMFINSKGSCANGHCGVRECYQGTSESRALITVFNILQPTLHYYCGETVGTCLTSGNYSGIAAIINDGHTFEYQQPTPKQRILAALYDIKAMETPAPEVEKPKPAERIRTVYVAVPETIKEQAKELVMQ